MSPLLPAVLLVGCGRMGRALLTSWIEGGIERCCVVDPAPRSGRMDDAALRWFADTASLPGKFSPQAVVFAVKPQHAATIVPQYARFAGGAVFLSIMAGRTLGTMHAALGPAAAIVRAMPNMPATIRRGTSVAVAGPNVSQGQRSVCTSLLAAVGAVAWLTEERLLDPVTAISGSGPAYVFLLAELLEKAALQQGLPPNLARLLARRTVSGAGALLDASDEDAGALRTAVTSPGGTTERALAILMNESAWPAMVTAAVAAATNRSRELAG